MKQICLAILNYETTTKELPPSFWTEVYNTGGTTRTAQHSTLSFILPQLEQEGIADRWDFTWDWEDSAHSENNQLSQTLIPTFRCPSVPFTDRADSQSAKSTPLPTSGATDYTVCEQINLGSGNGPYELVQQRLVKGRTNAIGNWQSVLSVRTKASLRDGVKSDPPNIRRPKLKYTIDGLSNTFMFFETGGRPIYFKDGSQVATKPETSGGHSWAKYENWHDVHNRCGTSFMNCNNNEEIYSFHQGGCFYGYGDGSVHFHQESMDPDVFVSLFTRDCGEVIAEGGY